MAHFGLFVAIFGVYYISGVNLLDTEEDAYNKVRVEWTDDPCDTWELKVPDYNAPGRRVSEVKCLEIIWRIQYYQRNIINAAECETRRTGQTFLLGGNPATYGEYPHMGALGWKAKVGTWIFKCGSSLISEKFVLTAAHCSRVRSDDRTVADLEPKIVRLGSVNILDTNDGSPAYDVGILRFIKYPRYNSIKQYFDIALVELVKDITFSWRVHPSCLWSKFDNPDKGVLTGWGVTETGNLKTSPTLQRAEIGIVDSVPCDEKLKLMHNRKWYGVERHQLCAFDKAGRIDACQGDSGGPLQIKIPLHSPMIFPWNVHKIVGVTSFGFGCARKNTPGIYTRVASFVGWIESIVWPMNITRSIAVNEDRFLFAT